MALPQGDEWDHPLNLVNWYALQQLMVDPSAEPEALKLQWAQQRYGDDVAATVVDVLDRVTEAARGMYEFDALWTANHSRFPTLDHLDCRVCGPYRCTPRMTRMMGLNLPLDMYSPEREAEIRRDSGSRMVFNQLPITPELKAEAMAQKDRAVAAMEEAVLLWKSLTGKIEEPAHGNVRAGLEGNLNDTIAFRHMMDIYMDWKLGVLTEAKIDAALEACGGRRGIVVPDPVDPDPPKVTIVKPASLKTFGEQLRRELREPWIEEHLRKNPHGVGVVDPIEYAQPEDA